MSLDIVKPAAPVLAGLVGLVVGSFLNVVVHRVPRGESIVFPGSHCPHCGRDLTWWENVPVLSWIGLRGRCFGCKTPISPRYPLVELMTGALFAASAMVYGLTPASLAVDGLCAVLVAVLFFDLDHLLIPDSFSLPCAIFAFAFSLAQHRALAGLESGVIAGGAFALVHLATRGRGMGFGDVKLAAAIGLGLPVASGIALIVVSFAVGAIVALPVVAAGSRGRRDALPFGPFLVTAAYLLVFAPALAFGPFDAYRRWMEARWLSP
ncbi:MAG TPA: prepilin peptidase [Candidatus Eremiobacteraceae bacterium]|nr:prepilin peptidase [Candidatus Eremiobacteraceae bacterium]